MGDCWLLARPGRKSARRTTRRFITSMFRYDGTTVDNGATVGLYTVRFYNTSGSAFTVNVDTDLPFGGEWYDNLTSDMGTQSLWVALAEKAYAEANALGYVTTHFDGVDAYEAMNNGDPTWALSAITGEPASNFAVGTPSQVSSSLAADWKAGDLIALCTTKPSSSSIVSDHCYAVVGYNAASSEPFDFMNPWGSNSSGWAGPRSRRDQPGLLASSGRTGSSSRKTSRAWVPAPGRQMPTPSTGRSTSSPSCPRSAATPTRRGRFTPPGIGSPAAWWA